MRQINLLPWREARRKQQKRAFGVLAGCSLVVAAAIVGAVHLHFSHEIDVQTGRNDYLRAEIEKQKGVADEIKTMEETKSQIMGRMDVIQSLQKSRPEMVHVFDEMVKVLPEEVYLTDLTRQAEAMKVTGVARNNNLVSNFMRNIEASDWFGTPALREINNKDIFGVRASFFELGVTKKKLTAEEDVQEDQS